MGLHDRDWFKEDQDQRAGSSSANSKSVDDWLAESRSRPVRKVRAGSKGSALRLVGLLVVLAFLAGYVLHDSIDSAISYLILMLERSNP